MAALADRAAAFQIEDFLAAEQAKDLLRFTTAGSVDDGKSTLIGRLLYDSQSVYEDQLKAVTKASVNRSAGPIDFSLLTDGLRAEREQGITIERRVSLFRHGAPQIHHRRHAGARAVHAQHGHRRVHRRSGRDPDRRAQRRVAAIAAAWLHCVAARHPEPGCSGKQDGRGGLRRSRVPLHRSGISRFCRAARRSAKRSACLLPADQRAPRRQRGAAQPEHALVPGALFAGVSGDRSGPPHARHGLSFSRAARNPAGSRLSRLCRTSCFRRRSPRRWHSGAAFGPPLAREEHRNIRRNVWTKPLRRCR